MRGRVRDLTHAGDAVIETDSGIVLARGALPGERVGLRVTGRRRGALRGEVLEIVEASSERVEPVCGLAERCGGCPLMSLRYTAQLEWKRTHLQKQLARVGSAIVPEVLTGPTELGYRTRARLAFAHARGRTQLGYRAAHSHALVDVERCPVLVPVLEAGLTALRETLAGELRGTGEIVLALGAAGLPVAHIASRAAQSSSVRGVASALVEARRFAGIALASGEGRAAERVLDLGDPRQQLDVAEGAPLSAPPDAFAQANAGANALLARRVAELAEPRGARVLELYAGHGNLTLGLLGAAQLTCVELDRGAAAALQDALRARGVTGARVLNRRAEQAPLDAVDVLVLDPPREGARAALANVERQRPSRIVYVSCDPATLTRDLGQLAEAGYAVDAAVLVDMFPQTAHLETVVRLRRASGPSGERPQASTSRKR